MNYTMILDFLNPYKNNNFESTRIMRDGTQITGYFIFTLNPSQIYTRFSKNIWKQTKLD